MVACPVADNGTTFGAADRSLGITYLLYGRHIIIISNTFVSTTIYRALSGDWAG